MGQHQALVTGAGRNVGQGIALALAEAGYAVAVNDLHAQRAAQTVELIKGTGGTARAAVFDVTDSAEVRAVTAELGDIDILVNNAGISEAFRQGPFLESAPQDWHVQFDLNLFGPMTLIHALLPGMVARRWGRVVQISSGAAARGLNIGVSLYAASKAGIEGLLRHVANEVASSGVTVNALELGMMDNTIEAAGGPGSPGARKIVAGIPVGRAGLPSDVGGATSWLCSEAGGWVTGQVIHLNGGAYNGR